MKMPLFYKPLQHIIKQITVLIIATATFLYAQLVETMGLKRPIMTAHLVNGNAPTLKILKASFFSRIHKKDWIAIYISQP